jgi:hypothetical protein
VRVALASSLFGVFAALAVACGGPAEPPAASGASGASTQPVATAATGAGAAPASSAAPAASASPAASAAPASSAAPEGKPDGGKRGVARWKEYDGPRATEPLKGPTAWTVYPTTSAEKELSFGALGFGVVDFVRAEGEENVFTLKGKEFAIPAGLSTDVKPPQGLKKGDGVLINLGPEDHEAFGRVLKVGKDTATVTFFLYNAVLKTQDVPLTSLLRLEKSLKLGTPVAFWNQTAKGYQTGIFLSRDEETAWVLSGYSLVKSAVRKTHPYDLKAFAKGAVVMAKNADTLEPANVTSVLDNGVRYEVVFEGGDEKLILGFTDVMPFVKF